MKTLKYILIACMVMSLTAAYAVEFPTTSPYQPATPYQPTSTGSITLPMVSSTSGSYQPMTGTTYFSSGSALPMAAASGVQSAEDINPARRMAGPRREGENGPFGGETIEGTETPNEPGEDDLPLGDGLWILLALALSYAILSRRKINE